MEFEKTTKAITRAIQLGKEVCISAAIKYKDKIWRGHRHLDCMTAMKRELEHCMTRDEIVKSGMTNQQGFITNYNRYVTREQALVLHKDADIPSAAISHGDDYRGNIMFSEDLY